MDDQGSVEKHRSMPSQAATSAEAPSSSASASPANDLRLTRICIRRFVNVFLAFHRHMHLWNNRIEVPPPEDASFNCGIKLHHILAASDDFNKLSMYWDLMPAAKLNYVHDFRGYFNCISQVVYFHDQEYERKPQVSFFARPCAN
jgi:hypothetical protein